MGGRGHQYAAGLRRLVGFVAGLAGFVTVASLVLGLLLGSDLRRAVAVGFYVTGCILVVVGVFYGIRPPVRTTGEQGSGGVLGSLAAGGGSVRWASHEDLRDSLSTSALFVTLGFACIAMGIVVDPRDGLL